MNTRLLGVVLTQGRPLIKTVVHSVQGVVATKMQVDADRPALRRARDGGERYNEQVRPVWAAAAALAVAAALLLSAVTYEVVSLGASLTRVVRDLRGAPAPSARPARPEAPGAPRPAPGAGAAGSGARKARVSFTLGEEELSGLLRRRDRWLGGVLAVRRAASCRLDDGHVAIDTRNEVQLFGLPVASYPGFSDWALTALPGGVGLRLHALRLAGLPVPGASWLLVRFGPSEGDWVVVRTGTRTRVDRVEVGGGRLTVAGTIRGRG